LWPAHGSQVPSPKVRASSQHGSQVPSPKVRAVSTVAPECTRMHPNAGWTFSSTAMHASCTPAHPFPRRRNAALNERLEGRPNARDKY
jgi:hypothetical protein